MASARPTATAETTVRPKTRGRILDACRDLFNARGPGSVTTAEIAASVGINEGNLYYHFQRKEQILDALFDAFEERLRETAADYAASGEAPGRHRDYLRGWFRLMWEWRFFYRDGASVFHLAPALRLRLRSLSDDGQAQTRRALDAMCRAGLIAASPDRLDALVVNTWIVSTYWLDYLHSRRGVGEVTREHIDWGAAQVMSLFLPYLTEEGRAVVDLAPTGGITLPGA